MNWNFNEIQSITAELQEDAENLSTSCGELHYARLLQTAKRLAERGTSTEEAFQGLDSLLDYAHKSMSRFRPGKDLTAWRRFYTDACILRALSSLESASRASIAYLDRAIIIAGAPGPDRLDYIHALIKKIQTDCLQAPADRHGFTPILMSNPYPTTSLSVPGSSSDVPCLHKPPSLATFLQEHSHYPFILRGFAGSWPALQEHPWSSLRYLQSVAGPGRIIPVEVGGDYRDVDWTSKLIDWDEFLTHTGLDVAATTVAADNKPPMYLAQHNLFTQFPALRDDIIVPDYVYASPAPIDYPSYQPPGNDDQLVINAWLGPKGTVSPAHVDPYFNFYTQVVGYKTVWLAKPGASKSMYPISPADGPSMENTSSVDVFADGCDGRFPEFWTNVAPHAMSTKLGPGDVLFFPPGWWHAMRSETPSFSVSMWF